MGDALPRLDVEESCGRHLGAREIRDPAVRRKRKARYALSTTAGSARPGALPPQRSGPIASASVRLALGYEDLNDHGELRHDLALQTAVGAGA